MSRKNNFIDPEVAVNVIDSIVKTAGSIFGKDEVPNYPIKSGNTYNKLVGIVTSNLPNPQNVEEAKALLSKAINLRNAEQTGGNGGDANKTIIMMYGEAISALEKYISSGGTMGGDIKYTSGSGGQPTNTYPSGYPYNQTAGANNNTMLYILLGVVVLAAVVFIAVSMAKRKS